MLAPSRGNQSSSLLRRQAEGIRGGHIEDGLTALHGALPRAFWLQSVKALRVLQLPRPKLERETGEMNVPE